MTIGVVKQELTAVQLDTDGDHSLCSFCETVRATHDQGHRVLIGSYRCSVKTNLKLPPSADIEPSDSLTQTQTRYVSFAVELGIRGMCKTAEHEHIFLFHMREAKNSC